jgi:phosphatidylglycerophosphate synthase
MKGQAANLLSALRFALAPLLAVSICAGAADAWARLALPVFAIAAVADIADGWVARCSGAASSFGRWLDHVADIVFLLAGFSAFAARAVAPWWAAASIAAAFSVYVGDSLRGGRGTLVGSRLGHLSGVLNYALLGTLVIGDRWALWAPAGPLSAPLLLSVVPLYCGAAIVERLRARVPQRAGGGA